MPEFKQFIDDFSKKIEEECGIKPRISGSKSEIDHVDKYTVSISFPDHISVAEIHTECGGRYSFNKINNKNAFKLMSIRQNCDGNSKTYSFGFYTTFIDFMSYMQRPMCR